MFGMPTIRMTPSDDPLDAILSSYRVEIDADGLTVDSMTDIGVPVGELEPIGDCSLTPGHPSPVGRSVDGDLAYVVRAEEDHVRLTRAEAAHLAHLFAQAHAGTTLGQAGRLLLDRLLHAAAPKALFPTNTAHGELAWRTAVQDAQTQGVSRFGHPFQADL